MPRGARRTTVSGICVSLAFLCLSHSARADGGLDALGVYFELLAAQAVVLLVGAIGLTFAMVSRSRNARVFGIVALGLNAVMAFGSYVLLNWQRAIPLLSHHQAALALLGTAMLIVDARAKAAPGVPAQPLSPWSSRWVLGWVLARGAVASLISMAQGPLISAIASPDGSTGIGGGKWTLAFFVAGTLNGGLVGFVESLFLRRTMRIGTPWIVVTAVAGGASSLAGAGGAARVIGALLGGAVIGAAQWSVLRGRVRASGWWIVVTMATSMIAWMWTTTAIELQAMRMLGILVFIPVALQSLATGLLFRWWSRQTVPSRD